MAKSSVDLWYLTILFRKLTEVIRFHGVRGPCAMGLSVVLNKIIKGWLGFSDPSQERNLYAGKRMDDFVPFEDDLHRCRQSVLAAGFWVPRWQEGGHFHLG